LRSRYQKIGLSTTKPGSLLKKHIPIRVNQWDETKPGFLEADTVAHCGTSMAGMFVYTVNTVEGGSKNSVKEREKIVTLKIHNSKDIQPLRN